MKAGLPRRSGRLPSLTAAFWVNPFKDEQPACIALPQRTWLSNADLLSGPVRRSTASAIAKYYMDYLSFPPHSGLSKGSEEASSGMHHLYTLQ